MSKLLTIDVVVPCFNESEVIGTTLSALSNFAEQNSAFSFRFITVDDGSSDDTKAQLLAHAQQDSRFSPLILSRNFGHQIAVTAGIDASDADATVIIDADLQDPVEVINQMIEKWQSGYDVVYGTRSHRAGESFFKVWSAKTFYRFLNRLSDVPIPHDTGDFRLMSRRVVNALKQMPEHQRFIRGMVAWIGFNQTSVHYERAPRFAGTSKYPLRKMIKFATDGILSFSNRPLSVAIYFGFWCSAVSLGMGIYFLFATILGLQVVPGWASTIVAIFFLGGVQILGIGLIGEYVGRIYTEVKNRPIYLVDETATNDKK